MRVVACAAGTAAVAILLMRVGERPVELRPYDRADELACLRNAKQISDAFWRYVFKEQQWPGDLDQLVPYMEGVTNPSLVLVCPAATNRAEASYALVYEGAPVSFGKPTHAVMLREKEAAHDGRRTIVRFDGTLERIRDDEERRTP